MDEQSAKAFFDKSPTAFSLQTIITNEDNMPIDCAVTEVNGAFEKNLGIRGGDAEGRRFSELFAQTRGFDFTWTRELREASLHRRPGPDRKPTEAWFRMRIFPMDTPGESTAGCIFEDVTQERLLDQDVRGVVRVSSDILCEMDADWKFTNVNDRFTHILGYTKDDLTGISYLTLLNIDDVPRAMETMKALREKKYVSGFSNLFHCKHGTYRRLEWSAGLVGSKIYASARLQPEGEPAKPARKEEQKDDRKAIVRTDAATGLYNRDFFMKLAAAEIDRSELYDEKVSLLIMDVEHLKTVSDTWGHPLGGDVLEQAAKVVSRTIRKSDAAGYLGGDQIGVIMPQTAMIGATAAADKIRKMAAGNIRPQTGKVSASYGLAERLPDESLDNWFRRADAASISARRRGRNCIVGAPAGNGIPGAEEDILFWKKEWDSGNPEIDGQHRALLEKGRELIDISRSDAGFEGAMEALGAFIEAAAEHFAYEEQVLLELRYPEYRQHVKIHQKLMGKLGFLKDSLRKQRFKSPDFFRFIAADLVKEHFIEDDSKFFGLIQKEQE